MSDRAPREPTGPHDRSAGVRRKPTLRSFLGLIGLRSVALVLILVQAVVLARVFGAEVFGQFSFAVSVISILVLFSSLGIEQVMMRDAAAVDDDRLDGDPRMVALRRLALRSAGPATVALTLLSVVVIVVWGGVYATALLVVPCLLGVFTLRRYLEQLILGTKRPGLSFIASNVVLPGVLICGGLAVWLLGLPTTDASIAIVYGLAMVASTLTAVALAGPGVRGLLLARSAGPSGEVDVRSTFRAAAHLTLVQSGAILSKNVDILLTGLLAGPSTVAVIRILARLGESIAVFRQMSMFQYKPHLAQAGLRGDHGEVREHVEAMTRINVLTGVPLFVVAWFLGDHVLAVFGQEYVDSIVAFRIYMVGVLLMLLGGPSQTALSMAGFEKYASRALWTSIVVSVLANVALIPPYGANGCAVASVLSMLVLAVMNDRLGRRHLGLRPFWWALLPRARRR